MLIYFLCRILLPSVATPFHVRLLSLIIVGRYQEVLLEEPKESELVSKYVLGFSCCSSGVAY